jgi:hypothetical protein
MSPIQIIQWAGAVFISVGGLAACAIIISFAIMCIKGALRE